MRPRKLLSFINNAWSVYVDYRPGLRPPYYSSALDEDGGKFWMFGILWIMISIHQEGAYMGLLMARMGMLSAGESRKWRCSAKENRVENWSAQHKYGMIRQVQREIAVAKVALITEGDPEERDRHRCFIEHQIGTLERIRIEQSQLKLDL